MMEKTWDDGEDVGRRRDDVPGGRAGAEEVDHVS